MAGGVADHQGVIGDVFCDDCTGTDEGVLADGVATDDGAVGAERCAFFYEGGADLVHLADFRAWIVDVGKDHRGATEDAVFQCDTFIDGDVVLDFAFAADDGIGANDDILPDVAVFADFGSVKNVGKMPDFRFFAYGDVVVHNCCWVNENIRIIFLDSRLRGNDNMKKSAPPRGR